MTISPLHVTTTVGRTLADRSELEVKAQGTVAVPAEDSTKAVLGQVQNFQCESGRGTDDCTQLHARADEQVVARLVPDERVAVTWRQYHPVVGSGHAAPGQPYQGQHHATHVRVDARRLVEGDGFELTGSTLTAAGVSAIEGHAALQAQISPAREAFIEEWKRIDEAEARFPEDVEQLLVKVSDLVPGQSKLVQTMRESLLTAGADEVSAVRQRASLIYCNPTAGDPASDYQERSQFFVAAGETLRAQLADPRAMLEAKFPSFKVLRQHAELERLLVTVNDRVSALRQAVPERIANARTGADLCGDAAKVTSALQESEQRLARVERFSDFTATGTFLKSMSDILANGSSSNAEVAEMAQALNAAELVVRGQHAAFERGLADVTAPLETLAAEFSGFGACKGYVELEVQRGPDNQVSRWVYRCVNTGDQPWMGTVTFAQSAKNLGAGFESMALPGKGWVAEQAIRADLHYGLHPKAGLKVRLAVRGQCTFEVELPSEGTLRIPLSKFERMPNLEAGYLRPGYVGPKVAEKSGVVHRDGTHKILFYNNGTRVMSNA